MKPYLHPDIQKALLLAEAYYDASTLAHAKRVAFYLQDAPFLPEEYRIPCICLGLMHDLLEDTAYTNTPPFLPTCPALSSEAFQQALSLLTRPKEMPYLTYIQRFKAKADSPSLCAWWVKLADMKDHLAQTETLTERLKEKYLEDLPYLL